jgi:hypothetical protein
MTKYRPSNGTAGMAFDEQWCSRCERDRARREDPGADGCGILNATLVNDVNDPDYPSEWTYDASGAPRCTAFVKIEIGADAELDAARADPRQMGLPLP